MAKTASKYFVYMVLCEDHSLYTGIAADVVRRMREHLSQTGPCAKYTKSRRVVALAGLWYAPDRSAASKLEYRIKQLSRADKEELLASPAKANALVPDTPPATYRSVPFARRERCWEQALEG